jgi:hypothetical protein
MRRIAVLLTIVGTPPRASTALGGGGTDGIEEEPDSQSMASFGRKWQILLQKSATVMTGRLPGFWGTSCYFERGIREAHQPPGPFARGADEAVRPGSSTSTSAIDRPAAEFAKTENQQLAPVERRVRCGGAPTREGIKSSIAPARNVGARA